MKLTANELDERRAKFCAEMHKSCPVWDTALIIGRVNQYYFTGTVQDGLLIIYSHGGYAFYVRKSPERAALESPLTNIFPMNSYRDAAEKEGARLGNTYIETETVPCAVLGRIQKHFHMTSLGGLDNIIRTVRAVKSPYELYLTEKAGVLHHTLLAEIAPSLLREGMSEAEFAGELYAHMMKLGHQGITRFFRFGTEMFTGQISFGAENSLYPTNFDGPGGNRGNCPAAPLSGSRDKKLEKGDLVFVDVGFGVDGYHSDKTQLYIFGAEPPEQAVSAHRACLQIERQLAERLRPGEIPSKIYAETMAGLSEKMKENFMGFGASRVKFLGHGVGLHIDELPVIADGFDSPLEENMVIALEPKKGVPGFGTVGTENTYAVTKNGGRCLSGSSRDIIAI